MSPPSSEKTSTALDSDQVSRAERVVWSELWPRVKAEALAGPGADRSGGLSAFEERLRLHLPRLLALLLQLYGTRWDFLRHLE